MEVEKLIKKVEPDIRRLKDMKDVIFDKEWYKTADPELPIYYMYRGIERKGDLRYDITIIPPQTLGQEFTKTLGHYHKNYGEIYIVLEGEAIYLMQKREKREEGKISDVYFIKAKKGEAIIIPPQHAHFTINPSLKDLKMANWNIDSCPFDYEPVKRKKGACYYYTKSGWVKNENYEIVPVLREKQPLKTIPKNLDFLKEPKKEEN
ncbi:MAG: glucose-6-phosphate isomerase [Candidatus Nealsonbacteria bacterium]|nr:glucose-6-phosphate isomerase [Candidatus Nealsonbacteria bacterium]